MAAEVAVVRVISVDTENYKTAVYKAVVVTSFKGTTSGLTIYVGPFIGQRLGWEYVVFLRSKKEPAVPMTTPKASFGTVKYLEAFKQGNSEMETSYECVFDGKDTVHQCDYGVRVCTNYIVLPEHTPLFPSMEESVPFGCRWVRKSKFISILMNSRIRLESFRCQLPHDGEPNFSAGASERQMPHFKRIPSA